MVEFRKDLLTNTDLVVHCPKEEQAINIVEWMEANGLDWQGGDTRWSINRQNTTYSPFRDAVANITWHRREGRTILSYEEALATHPVEEPELFIDIVEESYDGATLINYDKNTDVKTEVTIPLDANLEVMAYQFNKFLQVQGYVGVTGVSIQRDSDLPDVTSGDLYGC